MADLGKYGPGEWPSRPAVLTWDDGQIVNAYQAWELGKLKKEQRTQLGFFGAWRGAVYKAESDNAGRIVVLLQVATVLEWAERFDDLERLLQFLRDYYYLPLPRQGIPQNPTWQQRMAERYCQNRTLLPVWLRSMTRPPAGHETDGAPTERTEPTPQQKLAFVPEDEE